MTKELARNILTEHIRLMGDEPSLNEDKEALSMAIQALSQEPCTDAVSREAVIEWLKDKDIIKLSSQEETARRELNELEPCDDAISREQAIKVIRQITSRYTLAKESCGMGQVEWSDHLIKESDAIDGLNELPSVTPIQKTNYYGVKTVLLSEDNK